MDNDSDKILLRIELLLRSLLAASLSAKLKEIRTNKELSKIFNLMGVGSTRSVIAKKSGLSTGKISGIWQQWEDSGLIVKAGKSFKKSLG